MKSHQYSLSMFLEKNSPLTPFVSHTIIKMSETGLTDVISKKHVIKKPNCAVIQETGNSLGMEKFAPLFALYITGCIVSLILLMIEIIFNKSRPVLQNPPYSSNEFAKQSVNNKQIQVDKLNIIRPKRSRLPRPIQSGFSSTDKIFSYHICTVCGSKQYPYA